MKKTIKQEQWVMLPAEDKYVKLWFDNDTGELLYDPIGIMNCAPNTI